GGRVSEQYLHAEHVHRTGELGGALTLLHVAYARTVDDERWALAGKERAHRGSILQIEAAPVRARGYPCVHVAERLEARGCSLARDGPAEHRVHAKEEYRAGSSRHG